MATRRDNSPSTALRATRAGASVAQPWPTADAIVLFGCKLRAGGTPGAVLACRIALALRAYRQHLAPLIVATGGRRWGGHVEAVAMRAQLIAAGVAPDHILVEHRALNTRDNCRYSADILRRRGQRTALVATSAWHLPRAMRNLRRHGVEALAPPPAWIIEPRPSALRQLRELLSAAVDVAVTPRVRS